jgi:hypothetical protein
LRKRRRHQARPCPFCSVLFYPESIDQVYCSMSCARYGYFGAATDRVWRKVDRSGGPDACWPWTGHRLRTGYGVLRNRGKMAYAHRVAFEASYGPIPEGVLVTHSCDCPPCCNPAHLFPGSDATNSAEMMARGRNMHVVCPDRIARGTAHGNTHLTDDDVRAIRAAHAAGTRYLDLAPRYGISVSAVAAIVRRKNWKHLP